MLFCVLLLLTALVLFAELVVLFALVEPDVVVSRLPDAEPVPARPNEPEAPVLLAVLLAAVVFAAEKSVLPVEAAVPVCAVPAFTEALLLVW